MPKMPIGQRIARQWRKLQEGWDRRFHRFHKRIARAQWTAGEKLQAFFEKSDIGSRAEHSLTSPLQRLRHRMESSMPGWMAKSITLPLDLIAKAKYRVGQFFVKIVEALNLDGPLKKVTRWTKPIWYPFYAAGEFFTTWIATRRYQQLLWGVPALILLLPILIGAAKAIVVGDGNIASAYRTALREARDAEDSERMQLFERKLTQLGADSDKSLFATAEKLAADGKLEEAVKRMESLAPEDQTGYGPAHSFGWRLEYNGAKSNAPLKKLRGSLGFISGTLTDYRSAPRLSGSSVQIARKTGQARGGGCHPQATLG